jgi:hypothetical protein
MMSATSGAVRDERMLSGISAFTWSRVALAYPLGFILLVVMFGLDLLGWATWPGLWILLGPAIALIVCGAIAALGSYLRQRSETEAGYTTRPGTSSNLDQLDFRTGTVIRRAGQPLLESRSLVAFVRGDSGRPRTAVAPDHPAFPPRTPIRVLAAIAPGIVGVVFLVGLAVIRNMRDPFATFSLYAWFVGIIAAVVLLFFAYTRATLVSRIRQISESRPAAMVFTSGMTPDVQKGMELLGVTQTAATGRFPVAVTDAAIEMWSNETPPALRLAVPWSEVQGIAPDSVSVSRNTFKAVDLQIVREGVAAQLPLAIYGRQGMLGASSTWANQVFDEIRHHVLP